MFKNTEMMKTKAMQMQDINLKSPLYNTSILLLVITMTLIILKLVPRTQIDITIEEHHVIVIPTENYHHKTDIALILQTDTNMKKILLLHNIHSSQQI